MPLSSCSRAARARLRGLARSVRPGVLAGLLLALPPRAAGQTAPAARPTAEGVLLNFQDAPLQLVLSTLAQYAGITVSFGNLPNLTHTLRSPGPVPVRELRGHLESVARAYGLTLQQEGALLRISAPAPSAPAPPPAAPGGGGSGLSDGTLRLYVHTLKHARAERIGETLREVFGLSGGSGGGGDAPGELGLEAREARRQRLALPGSSPPAPAGSDANVLGRMLGAGTPARVASDVQIIADPTTNALVIRASAADYGILTAAIEQLDRRPLQVLVEVLVAEVQRERESALGVEVRVPRQREPRTGVSLEGTFRQPADQIGDIIVQAMGVGGVRADVVLRALAASTNVNILSRPIVQAQNNVEARMLVGSQRPFVQISRSLPTDAPIRDEVIQYRDVGTQLTIRPTINPDGYVTLSILQEISSATSQSQFNAPIISTREAQTQLFLKDGHTAVIGGLVDRQEEVRQSGIPILRDLPLVGRLFRSTQRRKFSTELFLFITPHVLRLDEDVDAARRELESSTQYLRGELKEAEPLIERTGTVRPRRPWWRRLLP